MYLSGHFRYDKFCKKSTIYLQNFYLLKVSGSGEEEKSDLVLAIPSGIFAISFIVGVIFVLFFSFVRKYKRKIQMDILRQEMDLDRNWMALMNHKL